MNSLALRVALLVFAVQVVVLAIFAVAARSIAQGELTAGFDASLRANAEALATLTEIESDGTLELEFADEVMTRFSRADRPDLFAILDEEGVAVEQSESLAAVPAWVREAPSGDVREFDFGGVPYRGIILDSLAEDEGEQAARTVPIRVFFATSSAGLHAGLARVTRRIALAMAAACVLSALLAAAVARHGLAALRGFARRIDRATPERLAPDFDVASLPTELRGPAEAFNRLAQRVRMAFDRERQFTADAAHELRTPVAAIKVAVQAARQSPRRAEEDAELLADLDAEAQRLEDLCEKLLTLASAAKAEEVRIEARDWLAEVRAAVRALEPLAETRMSTVRWEMKGDLPDDKLLRTSATTTRRIVGNLVTNAIVHGGVRLNISIAIRATGGAVELCVDDDGSGIAEPLRHSVFERFFRADGSRSRRSGGAGLGLAICRALARSHGGDVVLEEKPSRGARFVWRVVTIDEPASVRVRSAEFPAPAFEQ